MFHQERRNHSKYLKQIIYCREILTLKTKYLRSQSWNPKISSSRKLSPLLGWRDKGEGDVSRDQVDLEEARMLTDEANSRNAATTERNITKDISVEALVSLFLLPPISQ